MQLSEITHIPRIMFKIKAEKQNENPTKSGFHWLSCQFVILIFSVETSRDINTFLFIKMSTCFKTKALHILEMGIPVKQCCSQCCISVLKVKGKACLLWLEKKYQLKIAVDWITLVLFCGIPLLNWNFFDLKAGSQHMLQWHAYRWILELSPFSPEGLSGFSISSELEDRVFLQLRKPVERVEAEVRVSINPLQERC